jgi:ABC-type nitrate/sulfonate/bicarbonate transport system permease component
MLQATPNLNTPRIFAAIVILTALSLGLFLSIRGLERLLVPWARPAGRDAPVQQP